MTNLCPTITEYDTMACCLDWSAPWEISERRSARRGGYSVNVSIILGKLRGKGWIEFGEPNSTFRVTPLGKKAMAAFESLCPWRPSDERARAGLVALLAAGMDTRRISRADAQAKGLSTDFAAALAGGLIMHAGYETTVAADDWLNSTEGQAALAAKGLSNDQ